ncbi:MAG: TonB-dependent copper receptor [Pontibacterium sp.]
MIEITEGLPRVVDEVQAQPEVINPAPMTDSGELLRSLNGVGGSRMGGRGIDPVVRGQQQTQLNVLLDGAYLHGGCPNRMDPPTTYAPTDSYDRVTVIKGNHTVVYGAGGAGGTLLFERDWPLFDMDKSIKGTVSAGYRDNGEATDLTGDVATGSDNGFIRLIAHTGEAGNYEDGQGEDVRSGYESESVALIGGLRLGEDTTLEASYEMLDEEDVLFPGAGMDSPYADSDTVRLKLAHQFRTGALRRLRVETYRSEVAHNMDNFSLRTLSAGAGPKEAPSSSDTTGARVLLDAHFADIDWVLGVDAQQNQRNATLINANNALSMGIQWPDVQIRQTGLFVEGEKSVSKDDVLKAGLRYDHVTAEAGRLDESFLLMGTTKTATDLYRMNYGTTETDQTENNLAGFITWTHRLNADYSLESTLSRAVRTADATERYMATGMWVGNPELEAEKHHQLDVVLAKEAEQYRWMLSGWYNRVDDYILRENIGMKALYRNIEAELFGAEVEATYQLSPRWRLTPSVAWVKGNNLDNDTSLSQISPITASIALDYQVDKLALGATLVGAAQQNDVCLKNTACNGRDLQATPGYGSLNLDMAYHLTNQLTFSGGVDNLFDNAYSLHENREDVLGNSVQVAEPGRSVWIKLNATF